MQKSGTKRKDEKEKTFDLTDACVASLDVFSQDETLQSLHLSK
jgi:hypothetical protein